MKLKVWIYRLTGPYGKMGNKFCYETQEPKFKEIQQRNKKTLSIFISLDEWCLFFSLNKISKWSLHDLLHVI